MNYYSELTQQENAELNFKIYVDILRARYQDNPQKLREFELSLRKFTRLIKIGHIELIQSRSSDYIALGRRGLTFYLNPSHTKSVYYTINGHPNDVFFRQLYQIRLNKPCGAKTFGTDIEYYIGGEHFQGIYNHLREFYPLSSGDHGGRVAEDRPDAFNDVSELHTRITNYYDDLKKTCKMFDNTDITNIAFGVKKLPKIDFNGFYIGWHLHLHLKSDDVCNRVIKILNFLSVWHNIQNRELWSLRLQQGYGMAFHKNVVRPADWHCSKESHRCIEYRGLNSDKPQAIKKILDAVDRTIKNDLHIPMNAYTKISKAYNYNYSVGDNMTNSCSGMAEFEKYIEKYLYKQKILIKDRIEVNAGLNVSVEPATIQEVCNV